MSFCRRGHVWSARVHGPAKRGIERRKRPVYGHPGTRSGIEADAGMEFDDQRVDVGGVTDRRGSGGLGRDVAIGAAAWA